MTPDEQYAANCTLLGNRPGMEQMPAQLGQFPLTNILLQPSSSGHLFGQAWDTVTQTWHALCSPHDPVQEAEIDAENLYNRQYKVFTLLGMGLGYFATAFAKRLEPWQRLVVWDLDANMFKATMYATDISPLFSNKRTDVFIGNEVIGQVEGWWLKMDATEKLYILPPFRASYTAGYLAKQYDALMAKTIDMMRFHAVGLSTWRMFGPCIGDNDLRNMPDYFRNPGYEHLNGCWQGKPAVCLGAGPSLQKNLRALLDPQWREKVAIITSGTVYALVAGLGLEPDVVTTIDFQRLNWTDQFRHVPLDPDCPLVYLHSTYPQTVRRWPGPRFVAENASDTVGWMRKYGEGKKSAAEVQTVAHLNVKVALEMGANPIILLGQDLSMPRDAHHTAGARAQDMAPDDCVEEAFVEAKDYQGKTVWTRHSFLSMKTVFERLILDNPDRTFINASEGGLLLEGAMHAPLREVLALLEDRPATRNTIRRHLKSVFQDYKPQISETFAQDFRQLCTWVDELGAWAEKLFAIQEAIRHWRMDTPDATWDALLATGSSEDILTDLQVIQEIEAAKWEQLLTHEAAIHERQPALALFAIRRFEFLELMSKIPPRDEEVATPLQRARFNGERLMVVATLVREELAHVQRLLREVRARLEGTDEAGNLCSVEYLYARQCYTAGVARLRHDFRQTGRAMGHQELQRLYAAYLYHTQQYEAASAIMDAWGMAPEKVARIRRYLGQWRAEVRQAMPQYFQETGGQHQPTNPAEAWVWE